MQKFKIKEEEIQVLLVTVLEGRGISVGLSDAVDTPDPYVKLRVAISPNAMQRTKPIPNEINPKWNSEFKFFLDPEAKGERKLEIIVMDEDFGFDDTVGTGSYDFSGLKLGEPVHHSFQLGKGTFVDIKLLLQIDVSKQLRYSYDICEEEKKFLKVRKQNILKGMKNFLNEKAPRDINEVPVVAVMGSGGGFRAMCGLSGVFAALQETGVLDCTTYVSGLSGSSWYISTLYSNSAFPSGSCADVAKEIKDRIDESIVHLLTPSHLVAYYRRINKKKSLGYPVSFTDFFGCLVGDTLLQDKSQKLTYFKNKVNHGDVPLPVCTAVHVEKDLSAQAFSEWVEFTPYEVGLYKYGVFVKTEHFGGKFYKGRLIREHQELPLHFLQGMWGSAFTILFQRLLKENEPNAVKGAKDDGRADLKNFVSSDEMKHINEDSDSDDEVETDHEDSDEKDESESPTLLHRIGTILASPFVFIYKAIKGEPEQNKPERKAINHKTKEKDHSFWKDWVNNIVNATTFTRTREGRAAEVHNMFRGLKVESQDDADDNGRIVSTKVKNTFLVDGGLDFNSPYPLLLRPERKVDIILSFDFSQRDGDNSPPFSELLLAESWAKEENRPFPPVASDPRIKDNDVKELYVFEDSEDIDCPIVFHFVLINKAFKEFKKPGIARETEEEKSFANFDVFDDEDQPYSSFTFDYTHQTFERLYELMKFNTLLNVDVIKEKMASRIKSRRNNPAN